MGRKKKSPDDSNKKPDKKYSTPIHIVAVGASAGGLEAIESFFVNMPADSGLGFIVIQHLSPDYKSLMVELLSKKTDMKVQRAEDGMLVLPDNVYLIPPKKNLTIFHGKLLLSEQDHSRGINLPIDVFLRSLAEDAGEKSVAIILSGTGSDGTRGVRSIKEYGGMVMVQDEESAKFDGMPKAAASTGLCDFILPPEKMPVQLLAYVKHPHMVKASKVENNLADDDDMTRLFALLREKGKVDFTFYKPSTVMRRIERRMTINNCDTIKEYTAYLQSNPGEIMVLFRELLIGVTGFFRDQASFTRIGDDFLPAIIDTPGKKEIRLWSAGCSTGEEAYSMAILLREAIDRSGRNFDVKIFATDIDKDAIQYAATGSYPESVIADIPPEYLARYFYKKEDSFCVTRQIREMVVFAQHNIFKDPPFTGIDLISCRNLLIYLQPVLQRKILAYFSFSLGAGGVLFLGSSETTGDMADFFETIDHKNKIFRSKGRTLQMQDTVQMLSATDTRYRETRDRFANVRRSIKGHDEESVLNRFVEAAAGKYFPLAVIVNEQLEVLHILGDPAGFFKLPAGKITNDITRMAAREISIPISTGIQKVFRENKELRFSNVRVVRDTDVNTINISIIPLPGKKGQESMAAVFIEENKKQSKNTDGEAVAVYDVSKETEMHIRDLEQELQFSRENLQATIEELETSNEELQATNEELLASNEELQSTNEELQSTNEELYTVNAEYHNKIIELTELHNDIDNLFIETHIATLFLDENLEIRRLSPEIKTIFKLLDSDIGRPITHISHFITGADPVAEVKKVQKNSIPVSKEILNSDGKWYLMRAVPYSVSPGVYSGVILSFIDISEIKTAAAALEKNERKYRTLFETMAQGVVYQSADGKITSANPAAEKILGLTIDQMQGRTSIDPGWRAVREDGSDFPGDEHPAMVSLKTGTAVCDVIMGVYNSSSDKYSWIKINAVPQFEKGSSSPAGVYTTFDDITKMREAEAELLESNRLMKHLYDTTSNGFALHEMIFDKKGKPVDYKFIDVNPAFEKITGMKAGAITGKRILEIMPGLEKSWIEKYGHVVLTGEEIEFTEVNSALKTSFSVKAFRASPGRFAVIFKEAGEKCS